MPAPSTSDPRPTKPPHTTCIDVTAQHKEPRSEWLCGPACSSPLSTWPNEALILEPGEVLVISMPNLSAQEQEAFEASLMEVTRHAGIEGRAVVIFGAEQLAVMKADGKPEHPPTSESG